MVWPRWAITDLQRQCCWEQKPCWPATCQVTLPGKGTVSRACCNSTWWGGDSQAGGDRWQAEQRSQQPLPWLQGGAPTPQTEARDTQKAQLEASGGEAACRVLCTSRGMGAPQAKTPQRKAAVWRATCRSVCNGAAANEWRTTQSHTSQIGSLWSMGRAARSTGEGRSTKSRSAQDASLSSSLWSMGRAAGPAAE